MERPRKSRKPESEPSLSARALRLLARREHTRGELRVKLAPHAADRAELEALLDEFTGRGWLSDQRAAEQLVRARSSRLGSSRLRQALEQRGVSDDLIDHALAGVKESELERARAVWSRKYGSVAQTAQDRARQVRFLQGRGFSLSIAMRIVVEAQREP